MAGLRLDERASAVKRSIVPGDAAASLLIRRVAATGPFQMPPRSTGKKVTAAELAVLKRWIAQGAPYAEHWSFVPPKRPRIPSTGIRNPIDAFILTAYGKVGLKPNPPADRHALIRRISLDLIGLPPSPAEVDAFVHDRSPDAYEKVVDRLLASPHFGEKWARPWLDIARYADSAGYGSDPLRPNLWPWRDWVINALNRNMPYDQFTIEQLAGDLLPNPTRDQLVATAFHRNTMTNTEGGTDDEEFRVAAVKDRAIVTSQVWMGLTMGCAQCHTHKFDPISQKDFYRFFAVFNQTQDTDRPDEQPTLPLPTPEQERQVAALQAEVNALEGMAKDSPDIKAQLDKKKRELEAARPIAIPIMRELAADKRRKSHVLVLANFLNPADEVQPGAPEAFHPLPAGAAPDRLGIARWLVSPRNPLTARVAVNRLWAQLFGTGIVETEEDFGHQGALPTHPELLDWLAMEFMKPDLHPRPPSPRGSSSWDVKRILKLIVMSETYRQSSKVTAEHLAKDPRNRLLARYPRRRLDAETVRDQALAVSGLLSPKIGGPSVYPPQPDGLWRAAFNGERTWPTSKGEDRYRRGLYTFWRRTVPYPSMATFDAPSREICTIRRLPTNTPLQALVTLNDPVYLEMAQALARRIVREGGASAEDRIRFALKLATAKPPTPAQVAALKDLYIRECARYRSDLRSARKLATDPLGPLPAALDARDLAAWTVVSNVIMNMESVLSKG